LPNRKRGASGSIREQIGAFRIASAGKLIVKDPDTRDPVARVVHHYSPRCARRAAGAQRNSKTARGPSDFASK